MNRITLTQHKSGLPVEIAPSIIATIEPIGDGRTRITGERRGQFWEVRESLDEINEKITAVKDPAVNAAMLEALKDAESTLLAISCIIPNVVLGAKNIAADSVLVARAAIAQAEPIESPDSGDPEVMRELGMEQPT